MISPGSVSRTFLLAGKIRREIVTCNKILPGSTAQDKFADLFFLLIWNSINARGALKYAQRYPE